MTNARGARLFHNKISEPNEAIPLDVVHRRSFSIPYRAERQHLGGGPAFEGSDPAPGLGQALGGRLLNTHAKNLFELKTRGPKRWLIVDVFVHFWD